MSGSSSKPLMQRLKETVVSSPTGGGGGRSNTSGSGGTTNSGQSSSPLLRRKDRQPTNALSVAARAFTDVVDSVEQAAKKVSLETIANAVANIARDKKAASGPVQQYAPTGTTEAIAIVLQHVCAPLWAIERAPMPVPKMHVPLTTVDAMRLIQDLDSFMVLDAGTGPNSRGGSSSGTPLATCLLHSQAINPLLLSSSHPKLQLLQSSVELATAYVVLLLGLLRWIESNGSTDGAAKDGVDEAGKGAGDAGGGARTGPVQAPPGSAAAVARRTNVLLPTFAELAVQMRDSFIRRDDSDSVYDDRVNDETQTADQRRRPLTQVGGRSWRSRGASQLPPHYHMARHKTVVALMYASIVLEYNYHDPMVHFLLDEIACRQLFLTSFSEGFSSLVAGVKGPHYLAKYLLHMSRDTLRGGTGENGPLGSGPTTLNTASGGDEGNSQFFSIASVGVDSVLLQEINLWVHFAVENLLHRNDTSAVLFTAFRMAVEVREEFAMPTSAIALMFWIRWSLAKAYIADVDVLAQLAESVKPMVVKPDPIGTESLRLVRLLVLNIQNLNSAQRRHLDNLFVGGPIHSYRRIPAYVLSTPLAARSNTISEVFWGDVGVRSGIDGRTLTATTTVDFRNPSDSSNSSSSSATIPGAKLLDDATVCVANNVMNVFQAMMELEVSHEQESAVDLRRLFRLPLHQLAAWLPKTWNALESTNGLPPTLPVAARDNITGVYMILQDQLQPTNAHKKLRRESPRLPTVPLRPIRYHAVDSEDNLDMLLKQAMDDYATSCDRKITDSDPAIVHPTSANSLRLFVNDSLQLVTCGGGGLLRRVVAASLRLHQTYPGVFVRPLLYVLPTGYSNEVASWIGRLDPVYRENILNPFLTLPVQSTDPMAPESWAQQGTNAATAPHNVNGLLFRNAVDQFLQFAHERNEMIVYQAELTYADPSVGTLYIPFIGNMEAGAHVTNAVALAARNGALPSPNALLIPQSATSTYGSSFSAERGFGAAAGARSSASLLSRQTTVGSDHSNSNNSLTTGITPQGSTMPPSLLSPTGTQHSLYGAQAGGGATSPPQSASSIHNFSVMIGDRIESLDKILLRMHGYRGVVLGSHKHLQNPAVQVPFSTIGTDLLDWISTTYHVYDPAVATRTAQALIDKSLVQTVAVPSGKDPAKFSEQGLYTLLSREELDSQPLCTPAASSLLCEYANMLRMEYDERVTTGGNPAAASANAASSSAGVSGGGSGAASAGGVGALNRDGSSSLPTIRMRVAFKSLLDSALQYNDLLDMKDKPAATRDIVGIKLKSTGSAGDMGPVPLPTVPTLVMSLHQVDKRRNTNNSINFSLASPGAAPTSGGNSGNAASGVGNSSFSMSSGAAGGGTGGAAFNTDLVDPYDHYQLKFGDRSAAVETGSCLLLEWRPHGSDLANVFAGMGGDSFAGGGGGGLTRQRTTATDFSNNASFNNAAVLPPTPNMTSLQSNHTLLGTSHANATFSNASLGGFLPGGGAAGAGGGGGGATVSSSGLLYVMIDGDVFGPLLSAKVRPVTQRLMENSTKANPVTFPVMSFTKLS